MPEKKKPASPRQVLLGVFILWQVAFLFLANVLGFVQWFPTLEQPGPNELINRLAPKFAEKQGNGWQWGDQLDGNLRRWTELTGQDQSWSLFAPSVSKSTGFPALLLSWDDAYSDAGFRGGMFSYDQTNGFNLCGPWNHPASSRQPSLTLASQLGVLAAQTPIDAIALQMAAHARAEEKLPRMEVVLSPNEPDDLNFFMRFNNCRIRRFEGNFYFNPQPYSNENPDTLGIRLNRRISEFTSEYQSFILAYMRWRMKAWHKQNPGAPAPKQIILVERFYSIHSPKETKGWDGPYVVPVARWLPELDAVKGAPALETFDFNEHRFTK
jgi:hypothetical protein